MPTLLAGAPVEELDYTLRVEDIVWQKSDTPIAHSYFYIGEPQVIAADKEDKKPNGISDYWVNDSNALLSFRSDATGNTNLHEDDPDPRSRGNLLHAIMESVVLLSDLPVAVEKMRVRGVIDSATAEEYERYLTEHIEHLPEVKAWFGEDVQVITERPILNGLLHKKYRPDRLVIDADGALSVVDYKFGNVRYDAEYFEQVSDYIALIKNVENEDGAPMYPNVKGYIWYVSHDLIVSV